MESGLSHPNLNEDGKPLADDTVGSIQDQFNNFDLVNPESSTVSENVFIDNKEQTVVNPKSSNHETLKVDNLDINSKRKIDNDMDENVAKEKENISKTVGIGDAEEGELDYEEEVPEEDSRLHTDEQRVENEEAELTDKDADGDKNGEGSEEGEIVTDDDDDGGGGGTGHGGDNNDNGGGKDRKVLISF